jgi:hypothetical protein
MGFLEFIGILPGAIVEGVQEVRHQRRMEKAYREIDRENRERYENDPFTQSIRRDNEEWIRKGCPKPPPDDDPYNGNSFG